VNKDSYFYTVVFRLSHLHNIVIPNTTGMSHLKIYKVLCMLGCKEYSSSAAFKIFEFNIP
jgi:hypothetical protein